MLNKEKYDDDEESWYYADGSGNLYAGEFKTIKGKKYAFRNDGRMVNGLKFIKGEGTGSLTVVAMKTSLTLRLMMMIADHSITKTISLTTQLNSMSQTVTSATTSVAAMTVL